MRDLTQDHYLPREVFFGRFGLTFPGDPSVVFAGGLDFFPAITDSFRASLLAAAHGTRLRRGSSERVNQNGAVARL